MEAQPQCAPVPATSNQATPVVAEVWTAEGVTDLQGRLDHARTQATYMRVSMKHMDEHIKDIEEEENEFFRLPSAPPPSAFVPPVMELYRFGGSPNYDPSSTDMGLTFVGAAPPGEYLVEHPPPPPPPPTPGPPPPPGAPPPTAVVEPRMAPNVVTPELLEAFRSHALVWACGIACSSQYPASSHGASRV